MDLGVIVDDICNIYGVNRLLLVNTRSRVGRVYECRWAIYYVLISMYGKSQRFIEIYLRLSSKNDGRGVRYGYDNFLRILSGDKSSCLTRFEYDELLDYFSGIEKVK